MAERIRLHTAQGSAREPGAMAADPALAQPQLLEAMRSFFVLVSSPDALPEFTRLQVGRCSGATVWCQLLVPLQMLHCHMKFVGHGSAAMHGTLHNARPVTSH